MAALASYTPITARASTFRGRTVASRVTNGTGKVSMRATRMPGSPPPRASRWLHALVSGPMCFFLNIVPFDIWLLLPVRRKRHSAFMENGASSPSSSSLSLSRLSLLSLFVRFGGLFFEFQSPG